MSKQLPKMVKVAPIDLPEEIHAKFAKIKSFLHMTPENLEFKDKQTLCAYLVKRGVEVVESEMLAYCPK